MPITDEEKRAIILEALAVSGRLKLPEHPTVEDYLAVSWLKNKRRWRHSNRLWKKFKKHCFSYLSDAIKREVFSKAFTFPLRQRLDYSSIARRCILVEPLPEGALPHYDYDFDDDKLRVSDGITFNIKNGTIIVNGQKLSRALSIVGLPFSYRSPQDSDDLS